MNIYKFIYILIPICVFYLSINVFQVQTGHLFALFVSALLIYYLYLQENFGTLNFNEEMEHKYIALGTPSHLYLDTNLIQLFYTMINWKTINEDALTQAVKCANNVLRIKEEIIHDASNCRDRFIVAFDQAKLCLNYIHSYVYSLEHPMVVEKLKSILRRLSEILEEHLDIIRLHCKKNYPYPKTFETGDFSSGKREKPFEEIKPFNFY